MGSGLNCLEVLQKLRGELLFSPQWFWEGRVIEILILLIIKVEWPRSFEVLCLDLATIAQLVEQCFRKAEVPSSILGGGSRIGGFGESLLFRMCREGLYGLTRL